ncbi:type II toxin-antitoxin system VapC family toxin [soil metagenome]
MRLLLDTHVLIWAVADPARLPGPVAEEIADPATDVLVSTASAWEIAIKTGLGRLAFQPVDAALLDRFGFRHHPIGLRHTAALAALPDHHGDPFDRILVAQAVVDDLALVSDDRALGDYDVTIRWA